MVWLKVVIPDFICHNCTLCHAVPWSCFFCSIHLSRHTQVFFVVWVWLLSLSWWTNLIRFLFVCCVFSLYYGYLERDLLSRADKSGGVSVLLLYISWCVAISSSWPSSCKSPWRNRLARSAVNRKVGGSSPPGDYLSFFLMPPWLLDFLSVSVNTIEHSKSSTNVA